MKMYSSIPQVDAQEKTVANTPVRVAVIGDFRRGDFRNILSKIREKVTAVYYDDFSLFARTSLSCQNFDLIFLLASGFGQYFSREMAQLSSRYPLARIVIIAGSLAEGERRTGNLPSEVFRYYWHQWESEIGPNFRAFCELRDSAWGLPPCSSEEERLLKTVDLLHRDGNPASCKSALILASDRAMRDMLVDGMRQSGCETATICPTDVIKFRATIKTLRPARILLDVTSEYLPETLSLVRLLKSYCPGSAQLIVFYNAPRADEMQQLLWAGVNRVVSKPFFLDV